MAPPLRTPRATWIEEGLRALAAGGPDAVRVDALAKGLGVTRGGFYWHFDDRGALMDAMLDTWERMAVDNAIELADSGGDDARARLRQLFRVATDSEELLTIDLAVRDWARRDPAVADRLRRVDNRRMDYLRWQFAGFCPDEEEVEVRSMLAFSVWIADHFVAADHGARTRSQVLGLVLRRLLA
jgi:AcrR family transcriptional regulator